jgi:hypothetical protein
VRAGDLVLRLQVASLGAAAQERAAGEQGEGRVLALAVADARSGLELQVLRKCRLLAEASHAADESER